MFDWLKRLFKKEEKIDWSKAKLIQDTKKSIKPVEIKKEEKLKEIEELEKKSFKIYEGFLICDKDKVENVENALRKIKEKDPTFPNIDRMAYLIVLRGTDKDELHKKLSWVVKNTDGAIGYWIREVK
jgi:hypothetical protein